MIRIFIADDHDIVREGLSRLFAELPDMMHCGEINHANTLINILGDTKADVLILDVNMPGNKGSRTVKNILKHHPRIKIIVFSMYNEDSHALPFLRAGASAFLSKKRSSVELIKAIRKVHEGGRYITAELSELIFNSGIDIEQSLENSFSDRELQVIRDLVEGLLSVQIADKMNISASTVNTHVQRIKEKLGVKTIVEIVRYAERNGLAI